MTSLHDSHELLADTQHALSELAKLEEAPYPKTVAEPEKTLTRMSGLVAKVKTNQARRAQIRQAREHDAFTQNIRPDRAMRKAGEEQARRDAELKQAAGRRARSAPLLEHHVAAAQGAALCRRQPDPERRRDAALDRPPPDDSKTLNRRQQARLDNLVDKASDQPGLCARLRTESRPRSRRRRRPNRQRRAGAQATSGPAAGIAHPAALPRRIGC